MDIRLGQIQPRRSRAKMRQFSARASTPRASREKQPCYHLRCSRSVASAAIRINPTTPARNGGQQECQRCTPSNVCFGSKADSCSTIGHVRFGPKADSWSAANQDRYSITSLARPSNEIGTVRPSALAVLRLTYSSTLVACWTGRSAGFSPLRTRPV